MAPAAELELWFNSLPCDGLGKEHWDKLQAILAAQQDGARLAERAQMHSDLVEELQTLCGEFGIHAGENRIDWLREQLRRLSRYEQ